jgi:hypothetical protein
MLIFLMVDSGRVRRWHVWLADALRRNGYTDIVFVGIPNERTAAALSVCEFLVRTEKTVFRLWGQHAIDTLPDDEIGYQQHQSMPDNLAPNIAINLSSIDVGVVGPNSRVLTPLVGGGPGELAIFASLLGLRPLEIAVADSALPGRAWMGWPAVEQRLQLTRGLDNVLARLAEILLKAINSKGAAEHSTNMLPPSQGLRLGATTIPLAAVEFISSKVRNLATARIGRLQRQELKWALAVRPWAGRPISTMSTTLGGAFKVARTRCDRWYADPFVFVEDGASYVFCEEFSLSTRKGVIAVCRAHPDGRLSEPRVVLEDSFHLSYPFVFRHGGEIWMLPEAAQTKSITLYRATKFPYEWKKDRTLISDVKFYDPTLVQHGNRFWMFLTTVRWGSSSWDNLEVYAAEALEGPWLPVSDRPAVVDSRAARSAGALWVDNGNLIRPAQDCSVTYGGGITLCRVDQLSQNGYVQALLGSFGASDGKRNLGVHTINSAGKLQAIDIFGAVDDVDFVSLSWSSMLEPRVAPKGVDWKYGDPAVHR